MASTGEGRKTTTKVQVLKKMLLGLELSLWRHCYKKEQETLSEDFFSQLLSPPLLPSKWSDQIVFPMDGSRSSSSSTAAGAASAAAASLRFLPGHTESMARHEQRGGVAHVVSQSAAFQRQLVLGLLLLSPSPEGGGRRASQSLRGDGVCVCPARLLCAPYMCR